MFLLLACTAPSKDTPVDDTAPVDTHDGEVDTVDTVDTVDSDPKESGDTGEEATAVVIDGVSAVISEAVVTVATVTWSTDVAVQGYVEFGETEAYGKQTSLTGAGTAHEVWLLGNAAETDVHFRVVAVDGEGNETRSGDYVVTTGPLPPELPELYAQGAVESWNGTYLVLPIQGSAFIVAVVDDQGRYVWYDMLEPGYNLMRALLSVDGRSMLYCKAGPQDNLSVGLIERVSLDGKERVAVPFPFVDHDFVELPDGTFAGIVVTDREGMPNAADRIVEQDAAGNQRDIYNAWDDKVLAAAYNPGTHNWTHANALDYDAATDTYYMSLKEVGSILKIPRSTGVPEWYLNGKVNQFTFLDGAEVGQMQHQFQMLGDDVVIFDNGAQSRGYSRAVELRLDTSAMTAEELWSYRHTPDLAVYAKGDVERYADGNTRVVWSTSGEIQDVTPDGSVVWQLNAELGYAITFVTRVESLYAAP